MKFRIFVGVVALLVLVIVGAVYLAATSASDLLSARRALQGSVEELEREEIEEARDSLRSASERLDGTVASILNFVPLVGPNIGALEAVADGAEPVLETALGLKETIERVQERDLVEDGRVHLELVAQLQGPLEAEAEALDDLHDKLSEARSGWLLPPVHDELTDLMDRTDELRGTASKAATATGLAPNMLGGEGDRTYLVILVNNAELRGAGGILSGVGTVTMSDGRIELGDFSPYGDLGSRPYDRVPAPPEFVRRFGFAKANSTLWVNTTYSPEVPDVALVASRLYKKVRKVDTDGAIVVDPRGIAALMPPGATVEAPSGGELNAETLPEYIYSTAYERLGGNSRSRRGSLLNVGRDVFKLLAERGPGGVEELDDIAAATAGGHLRFVSFEPGEQEILDRVGATGSLPEAQDSVYVNVQNQGADKLDFWIRRQVGHRCSLSEERAVCETTATLSNRTPDGLTEYVSPRPNNETREFLEIYVPEAAEVAAVELDGETTEFLGDTQGDRQAIGVDVRVDSGDQATLAVTYTLALEGSYQLTVTPQPLAHDAQIDVRLDVPGSWSVEGPEGVDEGDLVYEGELTGTLRFSAGPTERSGIARAWNAFSNFWNDELF